MAQPTVTIDQGTLRGSIADDWSGSPYFRFQGIPYAKPPVGELRFKAPQPPEKWDGILEATKEGNPSFSRDMFNRARIIGSEDCLYLNVYTKKRPGEGTSLQPVMVWIHGGGFIFGSGSTELYGPDFLITHDVVIVTINYRLGIFGFLSSENANLGIPGNAGFKDMVMALRWVQKNIDKFNGDPNNVTVFGESTGGSSVHLLTLSPMAKGLFHKAIAQSGSALNPWVQACHSLPHVGIALALDGAGDPAILKYLQQIPSEKLLEIQETVVDVQQTSRARSYGAVIEKGGTEEPFMSESPIDTILNGKFHQVPLMAGFTSNEGMCFETFKDTSGVPRCLDVNSKVPHLLGYRPNTKEYQDVADRIQKYYFGDEKPLRTNLGKTFKLDGDNMFLYGIHTAVKNQAAMSKSPVYLYRFSLETGLNLFKNRAKIKEPGTSHFDDVCYIFKNFMTPKIVPGSPEDSAVRKVLKLWTNFARYGNPTPEENDSALNIAWKPVKDGEMNFLDIGENLTMECNPQPEQIAFWRDIYSKSPGGSKYV